MFQDVPINLKQCYSAERCPGITTLFGQIKCGEGKVGWEHWIE